MKIELNVEGSQLDAEVKELLANLTDEQKQGLAKDMLSSALQHTESLMLKSNAIEKALNETNTKFGKNYELEGGTLRGSTWINGSNFYDHKNYFNDRVKEYSAVGTYFRDVVLNEISTFAKSEVKNLVEQSSLINGAIDKAKATIEQSLPKIVHDAMVMYFATQMSSMMSGLASSMMQYKDQNELLNVIQRQLEEKTGL